MKRPNEKIVLTLDRDKAETVMRALDFYSRIVCFQFSEVYNELIIRRNVEKDMERGYMFREYLSAVMNHLMRFFQRSTGIHEAPKDVQCAYDIQSLLRHFIRNTDKKNGVDIPNYLCDETPYLIDNTNMDLVKIVDVEDSRGV
jgi:hypothetical protein